MTAADAMLALAKHLYNGGEISSRWIQEQLQVSRATADRYMLRVEHGLPVVAGEGKLPTSGVPLRTLRLMPQARRAP